jgi:hypothetical protein
MAPSNELPTPSTVQPTRSTAISSIELQRRGRASVMRRSVGKLASVVWRGRSWRRAESESCVRHMEV